MGSASSKPNSTARSASKQRKRDALPKGYYDYNQNYWPTRPDAAAYGYPAAVPQYPAYYPAYYAPAPVAMPDPQNYVPPRPVIPVLARSAVQPEPAVNQPVIPPPAPPPRERPKKRKPARKKMPTAVITFELPESEHARRPSQSSTTRSLGRSEVPSPTRSIHTAHAPTERPSNPLPKLPVDIFTTTPYKKLLEPPELPVWPAPFAPTNPSVGHDDHEEQNPPLPPQPPPQKRGLFGRRRKDPPPPLSRPKLGYVPTTASSEPRPPSARSNPPGPAFTDSGDPRGAAAGSAPPSPPPPIYFNQDTEHAGFLNHSPHSVSFERVTYPTAAHLIEATKFLPETPDNAGVAQLIRDCADLADVYRLSHAHRAAQNDEDGESYMDKMGRVMYLKFNQHASLADLLLSTGDAPLVYDDPSDSFWGVGGANGEPGRNELGSMLENIRALLRRQRLK